MTTFFVSIENGVGADLTEFTLLDTVLFGEVYVGSDGLVIKLKLVTSDPVGYFLHVFQAICFVYLLFDGHAFGKNVFRIVQLFVVNHCLFIHPEYEDILEIDRSFYKLMGIYWILYNLSASDGTFLDLIESYF